jgi:HAD superfamily hydrolase (TIGR01484 family)
MRSLIEALGIVAPMINYNGAAIWNPLDDRPQYHEPLDGALALAIIAAAREAAPDMLVTAEVLDRWFTDRLDPSRLGPTAVPIEPDGVGPFEEFLTGPVTQVTLFPPPPQAAAVRAVLQDRFWRRGLIALFQEEIGFIRVTHRLVDKSIALQRIAGRMEVPRGAVMAVGDGPNDQGMVEWAGFGVAVANACPGLRQLADAVVASNDEQGVARAIHRHVLTREASTARQVR